MNKKITVLVLDSEGFELDSRDFDTIKSATQWIKECALFRGFWVRRSESQTFPDTIHTIQLSVDGEVHSDWFPQERKEWHKPQP